MDYLEYLKKQENDELYQAFVAGFKAAAKACGQIIPECATQFDLNTWMQELVAKGALAQPFLLRGIAINVDEPPISGENHLNNGRSRPHYSVLDAFESLTIRPSDR